MSGEHRRTRGNGSRQTGAPTIADVAQLAGVSTMTVSRVINGENNVREATRAVVREAIARLDYAPNRAARSLAGASQIRLGLLYSNPSEAYLSAFLLGSLDEAGRGDIQLVVQKCDLDEHEREVAERLVASGVDGIILPPPLCDSPLVLDVLLAAQVPTVVVATGSSPAGVGRVSIDDRAAARAMTAHLLALGHDRVGFITGNPNLTASGERLAGYREALVEAARPVDEALIARGLFSYRSGLDATEELLDLDRPPSAIFASNDDMAAASVAVAHRRGLDVPGDLTVVGFDDSTLATTIWPELTTIHQPIADMSRAAVRMLAQMLRSRRDGTIKDAPDLVLDHTLVRRQSDAAPRRRPPSRSR
ncbi:LacI family DNA-binding transcriptional regulator [Sphingomonas sp. BK235]|uniref:LacI family DNA-binding transcriptional regulator n=1 Tax=Sphingomonas sp. BK235 TaxID=2512131 RepID=UPI001051572A|nr:LacI family DNA-binding transcriptional regulator [Sphingomonas sp. BK235]TCP37156.1 LacI family transcriptional regulator [Sphingomonas sp. BK235]